jgi:subtilisin family serine protease
VSGTIGAVGNNAIGVAGVNWTVRLMRLKFLDANGSGSTADAITAIDFAVRLLQRHLDGDASRHRSSGVDPLGADRSHGGPAQKRDLE